MLPKIFNKGVFKINIIFLTDGVSSRKKNNKKEKLARRKNCLKVAKLLKLNERNIFFLDYPDNMLDTIPLLNVVKNIEKIKKGWVDVDVIVTMPSVMGKLGPLGKVLGPRGLMPNPKTGTVTMDIAKAVTEIKGGKIDFKVDKTGIIHASVGKVSFTADKIKDNANELINTIVKLKPSGAKGVYIKSISMSSTMSPGIAIESKFE